MTRLRFTIPPRFEREIDQFTLLSRDSVRSLLNAASMSRDTDPAQFALWGTVLLALPPAMYAFRQLFRYSALKFAPYAVIDQMIQADRMFFLVYGMLAAALLASLMWEALLPDRTDQEIVGVLPVLPRTLAAARLAAAMVVAAIFSSAISLPAGIMLTVAAPSHPALGFLPTVLVAHVLATMGGSLFVFTALLAARGAIAFCLGEQTSERLATLLQLITITALAEVFFFIPSVLPALITRMIDGDLLARALPPVWFAALYSWLVGTPHAALASAAWLAPLAFAAAIAVVVPVYLMPAAVLARRTVETQRRQHSGLISSLTRGAAVALPTSAVVRGILVFAIASLLRSRRHRLIVTAYTGLAIAIGTMSVLAGSIRGTIALGHPGVSLLSLPLVVTFFVTLGLRTAFTIPTDIDANWLFRLARPTVMAAIDATVMAILLVGALPIAAAASAGALVLGWGLRLSVACGHLTDAESLKSRWLSRIVPLILFAFVNAGVQRIALQSMRAFLWYVGVAAAAIATQRFRRWLSVRESSLEFDAAQADEMATLNLSEALS